VLQPSVLLNLDVRDNAKARKFVDAFANGQVTPWAQQEIDGVRYYSLPQESAGIIPLAPVLGLTDKALLFGLSFDSVQKAVQSAKSGDARLDKQADFKAASDLVSKPTGMFGYIDSKQLFEKVYGFASTYLKAMALFNPHAGDYADLSKLPSTEAVSKHLSPIVYSMGTDDKGTLVESAGPVTFNQALFALAAGAGWKFSTQPKAYAMPSGGTPSVPQLPSKPPPMQVPLNPPAGSGTLPSLPQTSPPPP